MKLIEYLGLPLKDDAIVELLEIHRTDVIYGFDRLHENQPDRYTASVPAAGFEMRFDEHQILETIWCYVIPKGRFQAVDPQQIGVPIYASADQGRAAADAAGWAFTLSAETGADRHAYIRIDHADQWHHYEYKGGTLTLVTLMRPWY